MKQELNQWKIKLNNHMVILKQDIQKYQLELNKLNRNELFWTEALELTVKELQKEISEMALIVSNIDLLLQEVTMDAFFDELKNLKIRELSRTEQRVLIFMLTSSVNISFREDEFLLAVVFRLMPFFDLENIIKQKTENNVAL